MRIISLFVLVLLAGLLTASGCRSSGSSHVPPPYQPPWVLNPKRADSVYCYVVGTSVRQPSPVAAREAAYQDALYMLSLQIANEAGLGVSALPPGGVFTPLAGVEILPDCVHIERNLNSYNGFVQVSFPIVEKRKLVEKLRVP